MSLTNEICVIDKVTHALVVGGEYCPKRENNEELADHAYAYPLNL